MFIRVPCGLSVYMVLLSSTSCTDSTLRNANSPSTQRSVLSCRRRPWNRGADITCAVAVATAQQLL